MPLRTPEQERGEVPLILMTPEKWGTLLRMRTWDFSPARESAIHAAISEIARCHERLDRVRRIAESSKDGNATVRAIYEDVKDFDD